MLEALKKGAATATTVVDASEHNHRHPVVRPLSPGVCYSMISLSTESSAGSRTNIPIYHLECTSFHMPLRMDKHHPNPQPPAISTARGHSLSPMGLDLAFLFVVCHRKTVRSEPSLRIRIPNPFLSLLVLLLLHPALNLPLQRR